MENFEPTYGEFVLHGTVIGLNNELSTMDGETKKGKWKRIKFGVKLSDTSIVYVDLFGNLTKEIKCYPKRNWKKEFDNSESIVIQWDKRYSDEYTDYRLPNQIKLNFNEDLEDERLIGWDAIEYIEKNVSNGEKVFVKEE